MVVLFHPQLLSGGAADVQCISSGHGPFLFHQYPFCLFLDTAKNRCFLTTIPVGEQMHGDQVGGAHSACGTVEFYWRIGADVALSNTPPFCFFPAYGAYKCNVFTHQPQICAFLTVADSILSLPTRRMESVRVCICGLCALRMSLLVCSLPMEVV